MVQIAGKYSHVRNENLVEYIVGLGVPEEKAQKVAALKPNLEVIVDGKKITINSDSGIENASSNFVLGEEFDDPMPLGVTLRSTAALDGDTLTVTSKAPDGKTGKRIYKFSDSELVITLISSNPGVPEAKRVYKRV